MAKCPSCGAEVLDGAKFCIECGLKIPQEKECPQCHMRLPLTVKFCGECGYSFLGGGNAGGGTVVGGRAMVGRDVNSTVNNNTITTTNNVIHADETRQVVNCHVCGKALTVDEQFRCPKCGGYVCAEHLDKSRTKCVKCANAERRAAEEALRKAVAEALRAGGGRLEQQALFALRQLRLRLGLDEAAAHQLVEEARSAVGGGPAQGVELSEMRRRILGQAWGLFYADGKGPECVELIDQMLPPECLQFEEVRSVLLPALSLVDEARAEKVAASVFADSKAVCMFRVERALRQGRLDAADQEARRACAFWPDDAVAKCHLAMVHCAFARKFGDHGSWRQAEELLGQIPETDEVLARSWRFYVANLVADGRGREIRFDDAGLFAIVARGVLAEGAEGGFYKRQPKYLREQGKAYLDGDGVGQSYEDALKNFLAAAEQGDAEAQYWLGRMHAMGQGVTESAEEAAKWYRRAAGQGNADAQYALGVMYDVGRGVPQSDEEAARWYRKAAEQGGAEAQHDLGAMCEKGRGVPQSDEEAARWYRKAAEQGHDEAQFDLGVMCENGRGVPQSDEEAARWYRKAADLGLARAQCNLGFMYEKGHGVPQSDEEAVKWYRKAADLGLARAQCNLGVMCENGSGVPKSDEEAVKWYRKAADQGFARAQCFMGEACYDGMGVPKSYKEAVSWYQKAADQGFARAQYFMGDACYYGMGVPKSYKEAVSWYQKAADQGFARAECDLGFMYESGQGVRKSGEEAEKWYRRAAGHGNAQAQCNLAVMYYEGDGVPQSYADAFKWFQKAAEQDHEIAQNNLGALYASGMGTELSYEESVKWFRKSAEQGHPEAQFNLGLAYEQGLGVPKSAEEAVGWYRKAAEQDYPRAQYILGYMCKEGKGTKQSDEEAGQWYRKISELAEEGDVDAQYYLGRMYQRGEGVRKVYKRAEEWYQKAAEAGSDEAQNALGRLYAKGEGVRQSDNVAAKWYREAAENGNGLAQNSLALMYGDGCGGLPKSKEKEVEWLRKSAERGCPFGLHNLGRMYLDGDGVPQSDEEALKLFRRIVRLGYNSSEAEKVPSVNHEDVDDLLVYTLENTRKKLRRLGYDETGEHELAKHAYRYEITPTAVRLRYKHFPSREEFEAYDWAELKDIDNYDGQQWGLLYEGAQLRVVDQDGKVVFEETLDYDEDGEIGYDDEGTTDLGDESGFEDAELTVILKDTFDIGFEGEFTVSGEFAPENLEVKYGSYTEFYDADECFDFIHGLSYAGRDLGYDFGEHDGEKPPKERTSWILEDGEISAWSAEAEHEYKLVISTKVVKLGCQKFDSRDEFDSSDWSDYDDPEKMELRDESALFDGAELSVYDENENLVRSETLDPESEDGEIEYVDDGELFQDVVDFEDEDNVYLFVKQEFKKDWIATVKIAGKFELAKLAVTYRNFDHMPDDEMNVIWDVEYDGEQLQRQFVGRNRVGRKASWLETKDEYDSGVDVWNQPEVEEEEEEDASQEVDFDEIREVIKQMKAEFGEKDIFLPGVDSKFHKKWENFANAAREKLNRCLSESEAIALLDCTVWGSAKVGALIDKTGIYMINDFMSKEYNGFMDWNSFANGGEIIVNDYVVQICASPRIGVDVAGCSLKSQDAKRLFDAILEAVKPSGEWIEI